MHLRHRKSAFRRLGQMLVLTAALMPVLVGLVALAVDIGVIATAKAQLQTAADSAALAGAQKLASQYRLQAGTVGQADITDAQTQAIQFASSNKVLGDPALLLANATNANTGTEDVVAGYLARPFDPNQAIVTSAAMLPYFNTVQVRTSRSATHGGKVPGYFSSIWGNQGSDLKLSSAAAVVGISGFQSVDGSTNANLLPIVLDKATFAAMIQGQTTDQFAYNSGTNAVSNGADGITESKLYPVANGYPGNWGTIKIGVSDNSTATLSAQIRYGITPAQLATYPNGLLQPDPSTGTIQFEGNPGISAGLKDDLASIIGKPVRIPIFDPTQSGGNGNNLVYTVVAFAPARLLKVVFKGKNKYVIVQPATPPSDPTAVWGGIREGPMTGQYRLILIR